MGGFCTAGLVPKSQTLRPQTQREAGIARDAFLGFHGGETRNPVASSVSREISLGELPRREIAAKLCCPRATRIRAESRRALMLGGIVVIAVDNRGKTAARYQITHLGRL